MLEDIKGIGDKTLTLLSKLGIKNIDDLINYYPFRYKYYKKTDLVNGQVVVSGIIETLPIISYGRKRFNRLNFRMIVNQNLVNIVIFNRGFMKDKLKRGEKITVIGNYSKEKNTITADEIMLKELIGEEIEPVYHLVNGLTSHMLHSFINSALTNDFKVIDYIPEDIKIKYDFLPKSVALYEIHNPSDTKKLKSARNTLKYEEVFKFMFKINYLKSIKTKGTGLKREANEEKVNEFIKNLPFKLTSDQETSVEKIIEDLKSPDRMNRLLLGDVGSGKTIVAIIAIYYNFLSGYQSALLAPTEILATQHFYNISKIFKTVGLRVELLKGGLKKKERDLILNDIKSGEIDLLICTHAVLEDDVIFKNLGLVITDEQHRFGVNQRKVFRNKGTMSDVLYMSATPIPRTYALTIYGDMDISMIKTKPEGRKEIVTKVVTFKDIKEVLTQMLDEIKKGHQIYVVSPLIEDDEETLISVTKLKEKIDLAFHNKVPSEVLHGKLKQDEKERIMENFRTGKIRILIATTVIEVGVDVKNASMMVIFNAERFGLSTLHQLRGRIGRNNIESKCILVSNSNAERLKVLSRSNDGFYISEEDFKLRGEGDLFGIRQSGDMSFKLANIAVDAKLFTKANLDANEFIKENFEDDFDGYLNIKELIKEVNQTD